VHADIKSGAAREGRRHWEALLLLLLSQVDEQETDPCNAGAAKQLYGCSARQVV
jgi:hypothetical protein